MNLLNIVKHLLDLAQTGFGYGNSAMTTDEIFIAERLFEVLKSFKDSYFSELYSYDSLEFEDEYDETAEEEEDSNDETTEEEDSSDETIVEAKSDDEMDDHNENEHSDLRNRFTLDEMEKIIEWVDQHPNARFATISHHAQNWIESKRTIISKYTNHQILNSDHCSFQQEYVSPRTLSFSGERTTEVVVKKKHHLTHSYTVQPATSADGRLLGKFFLILQEKGNEFGKRVQKDLIVPPNVVVRASKSGKSSGEKHHTFLNEVLRPLVGNKFLLFLDSWKTQTDLTKFRAVFPNQDSQLLIFPKGSTDYIQPQDLSLFRSWRFIHEKIEHYVHINQTEMTISDRQYFINIHSIIHNQLSAPQFKNLIKNGFIQARITNERIGQIEKPKDVCFKF
ncbi:unnamed protein product [Rotaria sordida]|uniref:DDE-1 domain-containing protein n=1 Tax=Rotaria sordida TaxID=392033 RepID=A0A815UMB8_9BILA|nr:unnamed protein product [Rotaria sordida]CAF1521396.1 unnamed protein product [Rotaria sordida]